MSRSFKKVPHADGGHQVTKQKSHKSFRKQNKQLLLGDREPFNKYREVTSPYDIEDYKFIDFENREKYKKLRRK